MALKKQFHLFGTRIVTAPGNRLLYLSSFLPLGPNLAAPNQQQLCKGFQKKQDQVLWVTSLFAEEDYTGNALTFLSDTWALKSIVIT